MDNTIKFSRGDGKVEIDLENNEINGLKIELYGYNPKDVDAGLFDTHDVTNLEFHFQGSKDVLIIGNILNQSAIERIYFNRYTNYESSAEIKTQILDVITLLQRGSLINLLHLIEDNLLDGTVIVGKKDIKSSVIFKFANSIDAEPDIFIGLEKGKDTLQIPNVAISPTIEMTSPNTTIAGKTLYSGVKINFNGLNESWNGYKVSLIASSTKNTNFLRIKTDAIVNQRSILENNILNKYLEIINFSLTDQTVLFTNKYYSKPVITFFNSAGPFITIPITNIDNEGVQIFTGFTVVSLPPIENGQKYAAVIFASDKAII